MLRLSACALISLILTGCAGTIPLEPFDSGMPVHLDLSGAWLFNQKASDDVRASLAANRKILRDRKESGDDAGADLPRGRGNQATSRAAVPRDIAGAGGRGSLVSGFPLRVERLDITQTSEALFLKFNLAVVHEYVYGEKTEVSLGQYFVERVSGWVGGEYQAIFQSEREKITERYGLSDDGTRLHRAIDIATKRGQMSLSQVYEREAR